MPFVDKSEIKCGSERTRSKLWYTCTVGTAACGRSSHGSLEMRGARKTLGKTYRKYRGLPAAGCQIMWKRLAPQQLSERETQELKTKSQTFVYDYDEHSRSR